MLNVLLVRNSSNFSRKAFAFGCLLLSSHSLHLTFMPGTKLNSLHLTGDIFVSWYKSKNYIRIYSKFWWVRLSVHLKTPFFGSKHILVITCFRGTSLHDHMRVLKSHVALPGRPDRFEVVYFLLTASWHCSMLSSRLFKI